MSTDEGWCFVSTGTGGSTSVLRANFIVTFLLHEESKSQKSSNTVEQNCVCVCEDRLR